MHARSLVLALLATALPALGTALAGGPDDPEVVDDLGDAGPAGVAASSAASDFDITRAWFEMNARGTWATLDLVSFHAQPPGVVFGLRYGLPDEIVEFGYGTFPTPEPPYAVEGVFGCRIPRGGTADLQSCRALEHARLPSGTGFTTLLPQEWAPRGVTLQDPYAAILAYPGLPGVPRPIVNAVEPALVLDEAGPGRGFLVPAAPTTPSPAPSGAPSPVPETEAPAALAPAENAPPPAPTTARAPVPGPAPILAITALALALATAPKRKRRLMSPRAISREEPES